MPPRVVRVAAVQMNSGPDVAANIATAEELVAQAAVDGAQLVVLPEKWNLMDDHAATVAGAEGLDGPSVTAARAWARRHRIALVSGSISERHDARRVRNTGLAITATGDITAAYRKIHMFDVSVGGQTYRESEEAAPGDALAVTDLAHLRVGMSICYDVRFPELYRALLDRGADTFTIAAAFTATTGPAHWEVLVRTRAIENQCGVIAAGQAGEHAHGIRTHGHSMIVDAWGTVLAQAASDGPEVVMADLDQDAQAAARARLPVLDHRRVQPDGRVA